MQDKQPITVSELSLPKGGGAIQGIGETFQANAFSGTAGLSMPFVVSPCRDFAPQMQLEYSSGSGNGPWGLGFACSLPRISRQTRKGTPRYTDTDVFVLSGAADLVPLAQAPRTEALQAVTYTVHTYGPRQEGLFALIEYYQPPPNMPGEAFWKVTSPDHIVSIFGKTAQARIVDPEHAEHIFTWLLEESYNATGDHQLFVYKQEDSVNIPPALSESAHVQTANRYIERMRYGNTRAATASFVLTRDVAVTDPGQWHFEVVFDYGEYDIDPSNSKPYQPVRPWLHRPDPFSTYHAGFEIRTSRRCQHTLMFHRFQELGEQPVLVHATAYTYQPNYAQLSECIRVTETGYAYNQKSYSTAALPPLDFQYVPFAPAGHAFVPLTDAAGKALPGLDNPPYHTLVDLFGTGIPGILYSDGATTCYRAPTLSAQAAQAGANASEPTAVCPLPQNPPSKADTLAYTAWQGLESFPVQRQLEGVAGVALQDVTGNGQLDVVITTESLRGYWEAQPDRRWQPFQPFETWPADFPAPAQTWVDMTGDGIADLVQLTAEEVHVYPSARTRGLGKLLVEKKTAGMPASLDGSPTEAMRFADMAGSGQAHLVRIRDGEVVYWPNLSYGRFGAPIRMDNAPKFGADFHIDRLFLADLDGSGTQDLIYVQSQGATVYFNRSGNAWSDPVTISWPEDFAFDDLAQVTFADVYGRGCACLMLSAPHALPQPQHWCYDFCQGHTNPYVLCHLDNNLGASTTITYGSSVDFYLADKQAGLEWITPLPFPVQVVTQVTATDAISGSRHVSQYSYHHGYYDGVERDFRGFGRVDRQDAEYFPASRVDPATHPEYVAPALSRTWYHTGAYAENAALSRQYAKEYYAGDDKAFPCPDSSIHWGTSQITPDEETRRQAYVALAGTVLRTEVYSLSQAEPSAPASPPYAVSESNFQVLLKQAKGTHPYAIFYVHPQQNLSYTYERNPQDPQIHQEFTLQVDAFGNTQRSCTIAYPRRVLPSVSDPIEHTALQEGQGNVQAMCTLEAHRNDSTPATYLLGIAIESQHYDLSAPLQALYQPGKAYTLQEVKQVVDGMLGEGTPTPLPPPPAGTHLLHSERWLYTHDGNVLPLGQVALPPLVAAQPVAEFFQNAVEAAFTGALTGDELTAQLQHGSYQRDSTSNVWWNPGLTASYHDLAQFSLPQATTDPVGNTTRYTYDVYQLLLAKVEDALSNVMQIQAIDYVHLHPLQMVDANGNTSEVHLDPLGRVIYASHYGHEEGKSQGFAPLQLPLPDGPVMQAILNDPARQKNVIQAILNGPGLPQKLLGNFQSYFYYDSLAWIERQQPACSLALVAEQYPGAAETETPLQIHLTYNDGFGRNVCSKSKVEAGIALLYDPQTSTITPGATQERWLTSGRTVYNNKARPVKQYEPYYINTPDYVSHPVLETFGVSATLYYDAMDRVSRILTAKGFLVTHTWTAWEETVSDEHDTIKGSPYITVNTTLSPDTASAFYDPALTAADRAALASAAQGQPVTSQPLSALGKALVHTLQYLAETPTTTILDNLGNPIIAKHLNKSQDQPTGETLCTYHTYDILGRELSSADSRLSAAGKVNFQMTYSLTGSILKSNSADAGTSWTLTNASGKPFWAYDARQISTTITYDVLHRPTRVQVKKPKTDTDPLALDQIVERFIYGDTPGAVPSSPEEHNLRGQLYQHYDQAGLVTVPGYSLLGHPLDRQRQFRSDYQTEARWEGDERDPISLHPSTVYPNLVRYDALGRITQDTDADGNKIVPTYLLSGRLSQVTLIPKDSGEAVPVVQAMTYNARSQRETIRYGNGTTTTYAYDPRTFAVTGITTHHSQNKLLQDLRYLYDPVGNIVQKTDTAVETVFNNNQQVEATATYTYDALYRLMQAEGRERGGATTDDQSLQQYTEKYTYDVGGNLTAIRHIVPASTQGNWTRQMIVSDTSNRAISATITGPGNPAPTPQNVDGYFDVHGNQLRTAQIYPLAWNYRDNVQQVTTVKHADGTYDAEYYVYDGSGQRVRKVSEQYGNQGQILTRQETLYLGGLEIRRTLQGADLASATVTSEYHALRVMDDSQCVATREYWVVGNAPGGLQQPTLRYHLTDHLGSCTVEVDETGKQISREEYSPYGSSTLFIGTGSASQLKHYRYSGKERDSITGFYYYGARYYAPCLGRWLSPDPAGTVDGLNLYAFVSGNPATEVDLGGMSGKAPKPPNNSRFRMTPYPTGTDKPLLTKKQQQGYVENTRKVWALLKINGVEVQAGSNGPADKALTFSDVYLTNKINPHAEDWLFQSFSTHYKEFKQQNPNGTLSDFLRSKNIPDKQQNSGNLGQKDVFSLRINFSPCHGCIETIRLFNQFLKAELQSNNFVFRMKYLRPYELPGNLKNKATTKASDFKLGLDNLEKEGIPVRIQPVKSAEKMLKKVKPNATINNSNPFNTTIISTLFQNEIATKQQKTWRQLGFNRK